MNPASRIAFAISPKFSGGIMNPSPSFGLEDRLALHHTSARCVLGVKRNCDCERVIVKSGLAISKVTLSFWLGALGRCKLCGVPLLQLFNHGVEFIINGAFVPLT